jgi:aminobenzoyl-glutamate utilization protein B
MSIGLKGALQAARVLAWTGFDILTDAELRQAARADFEQRVRERPYVSPLSSEMKHPLELPEWLTEDALKV